MATKLFLRNTAANGIGNFFDMGTTAGSASDTGVVNTTASGTQIQWTRTAGGTVLEFISGRAPVGGFTLAGTMSFSIWAHESNMNANCGARARVFKRLAAGSESEIAGGPWDDGVEFGTTAAEMTWTGTPTSTAFAENDRLIVRYYITNVGTMASGHTCTITYNAADAATGDGFFQINENVTFKAEAAVYDESLTETATAGESLATAATFPNTLAEAATVGETMAGGLVLSGSVSESITSSASEAAALTFDLALSEALASADSLATVQEFVSPLAESITAADALDAGLVMAVGLSEGAAPADVLAGGLTIAVSFSEAVTAADSEAGAATFPNVLGEGLTATASLADELIPGGGGTTYNDSLTEDAALAASASIQAIFAPALSESVSASEGSSAVAVFALALSESLVTAGELTATGGTVVVPAQYPLAGVAQTRPMASAQGYPGGAASPHCPLEGLDQAYPLGGGS